MQISSESVQVCSEEEDWGGNGDYAGDRWNPADFEPIYRPEPNGQLMIFPVVVIEPPDPDDYKNSYKYEKAWQRWQKNYG